MAQPISEMYASLSESDGVTLKTCKHLLRDYAACRGLVMRSPQTPSSSSLLVHAPLAVLPATLPLLAYEIARDIQLAIGRMLHNMSLDDAFIETALAGAAEVDPFTKQLFAVYTATKSSSPAQRNHPPQLLMLRSDYLLHTNENVNRQEADSSNLALLEPTLKLVEVNTIAAGFAGLISKLPPFHEKLISFLLSKSRITYDKNHFRLLNACDCAQTLANGLDAAHELYTTQFRSSDKPMAVLMVVQEAERNISDQKELELLMQSTMTTMTSPNNPGSVVLRRTFDYLTQYATLNDVDKAFFLDGYEISVVYYRDGYMPDHYKSEKHWQTRLLIEKSNAIKCPSVRGQLVGTKKVQQVFSSQPEMIKKYLPVEFHSKLDAIRSTLVGNYTLDEPQAIERALQTPKAFVMKPNREGGGNNFYDKELRTKLSQVKDTDERHAYILMDKINSPVAPNFLIRPEINDDDKNRNQPSSHFHGDTITEFGFYSFVLGNADRVYSEQAAQQCLVRTKLATAHEGGVVAGYAFLNSPLLVTRTQPEHSEEYDMVIRNLIPLEKITTFPS